MKPRFVSGTLNYQSVSSHHIIIITICCSYIYHIDLIMVLHRTRNETLSGRITQQAYIIAQIHYSAVIQNVVYTQTNIYMHIMTLVQFGTWCVIGLSHCAKLTLNGYAQRLDHAVGKNLKFLHDYIR